MLPCPNGAEPEVGVDDGLDDGLDDQLPAGFAAETLEGAEETAVADSTTPVAARFREEAGGVMATVTLEGWKPK